MLFRNLMKKTFLLLSAFIINGCIIPFDGGECRYNSIEAYAVVKEIKKDHVILILPAKYALIIDGTQNEKEITLPLRPVQLRGTIPIYIDQITKGSCVPIGYRYR